MKEQSFKAIISSDWNQCLAPCGPFDPITFNYPDLTSDLTTIFREYTSNIISLGQANKRIEQLLPGPVSIQQMDAYLDDSFITYHGVPDLIDWSLSNNILFMINTTGLTGYFQRVFAKKLLPQVPVLSANPMIRYPTLETDPPLTYDLEEIQDKGKNTESVVQSFCLSAKKIILIGDSGGDGPHFEWGAKQRAILIGSMAKASLTNYCSKEGIEINFLFGPKYDQGEERNPEKERSLDFMELSSVIEGILKQ
jgi:hypothetical protein